MTTFVFANNVNTTLSAAITTTDTSITLASSANLPTLASGQVMPLTLSNNPGLTAYEIVYVTAISGATLTVERAQEGTTAQAWSTGSYAYATQTAQSTQPALGFTPASLAQIIEAANVVGYGADPTGVKDSSVAFQNAFNSGFAPSIPPGTYKIGTLLTANSGLRIYGAGSQVCIINASTNGFLSATLGTPQGIEIEGLTINQATASTTGGTGVSVTATVANAGQPIFRDVVWGSNQNNSTSTTGAFSTNCALMSTNGAYFEGCQFTGPGAPTDATVHVTINGTSSLVSFQTVFNACVFTLGTTAIYVGNGTTSYVQGVHAVGCQFISIHDYVGFWNNSIYGYLADSFKFVGCLMGTNNNAVGIYANNVMHVSIIGNYCLPAVHEITNCSGVISGNDFYAGNDTTITGITVSGSGNGGGMVISGNEFFSFNGTGGMPMNISGTGNTIGLNGYTSCNSNTIAAGNIVADVNPADGSMTLPVPLKLNTTQFGITPLLCGRQRANGADTIMLEANTTASPTGYFLRFVNSGNTANVFAVDINGNATVGNVSLANPATNPEGAVQLAQVSTVTPQVIKYGGGGTAASTTYGTTVTFACPTAGFMDISATWQNGELVGLGDVTEEILVNGVVIESDGSGGGNSWSMYGTAAVSAGTNTVTVQYVVGTTALATAIFIRALATFLPNP